MRKMTHLTNIAKINIANVRTLCIGKVAKQQYSIFFIWQGKKKEKREKKLGRQAGAKPEHTIK